ncbi:MAG: DUF1156 domain-containing protein [Hyphomicrobiaceae bacterium]|nr:MAG: DUF1156 domain-containing protein [Hyphomicrobiaceae bacterium]
MTYPVKSPKKLIEVALPLDAINEAAEREKSIRHGHPSTLHLWWARRPLAAARAVIFSQMVNDPSWKWEMESPGKIPPGHLKASWAASRKRLFKIIEDLVLWENTTNEEVLEKARAEIRRSWREVCELNKAHPQAAELFNPDKLPALHDPFAGGGSIPLEAQRLGLEAYASDLNPVAVLINKAMIEIPPKFANLPPVNPEARKPENALGKEWKGAAGLAEDVRYYGAWMRDEAKKRIGHLYPPVEITAEMAAERPDLKPLIGQKLTVIAWLWARTVKSPNPAFSHVDVPLVSTFILSSKPDEEAYIKPVIDGDRYFFTVKLGKPTDPDIANGTKLARGANFRCLISRTPISPEYVKAEGMAGRSGYKLIAFVALGPTGRVYFPPVHEMEITAVSVSPFWKPELQLSGKSADQLPLYGINQYWQVFTSRQLLLLTTISDIILDMYERIRQDSLKFGMSDDCEVSDLGSIAASLYAEAISIYLAFASDKVCESSTTLCTWSPLPSKLHIVSTFGRQALQMTWDFAESNPFADSSGNILRMCELVANVIERQCSSKVVPGSSFQANAIHTTNLPSVIISTDPPYYDNICYADLSDFFYLWLRRSLKTIAPSLFATLATPKNEELIANPYRHQNREQAEVFFLGNMTRAMEQLVNRSHPGFPVTIYYAFKQSEGKGDNDTASTGWETFLEAVITAGFGIGGTWPMRTERSGGFRNKDQNALASSIILVCRKRPTDASTISRREFLRELNTVLPEALDEMTKGAGDDRSPVAPVDLSQAIIGPGMAVFSKYAAVLEADGTPMSVRTALQLINRFLAEDDFDPDTQFCLHWFDQYGWAEGVFGEADVLARAKSTSVNGLAESGVLHSGSGKVRLLRPDEYPAAWNPETDNRLPIWEALHQLIRVFRQQGESGAGQLLAAVKAKGEGVRQLAYRLYTLCERQGWAEDARAYNELITSWSGIESAASEVNTSPLQPRLIE